MSFVRRAMGLFFVPFDDCPESFENDFNVHPEWPVFNIVAVQAYLFFEIQVGAAADLGEAGDAWFDREDELVMLFVIGYFFG